MGHVDRIARTDIDFLQYRLLYNGLLSEARSIHAIYEEASSWVGVFPTIYSHIGHKKDIEEASENLVGKNPCTLSHHLKAFRTFMLTTLCLTKVLLVI